MEKKRLNLVQHRSSQVSKLSHGLHGFLAYLRNIVRFKKIFKLLAWKAGEESYIYEYFPSNATISCHYFFTAIRQNVIQTDCSWTHFSYGKIIIPTGQLHFWRICRSCRIPSDQFCRMRKHAPCTGMELLSNYEDIIRNCNIIYFKINGRRTKSTSLV